MRAIREVPKPVVAAVNGPAVGIGCSLALCCDLILAAESAYFLLAFVNIGLVPDGGSSLFVPTRVGHRRARPSSRCSASGCRPRKALEWGLINRVVRRRAAAGRGARRSPHAWPRARRAPTRAPSASSTTGSTRGWTSSSSSRRSIQQEMAGSEDFVEGAMAFVEKRPARFSGTLSRLVANVIKRVRVRPE